MTKRFFPLPFSGRLTIGILENLSRFFTQPVRVLGQVALLLVCFGWHVSGQTDETIFREFQFDFSTPGARANGMGRAFVGLADEATAAYSNPAGLSVLKTPEFSLEFRQNQSEFDVLRSTERFTIEGNQPERSYFSLSRIGFASLSFSWRNYNFSAFFVNNLDYRRDLVEDTVRAFENVAEYGFTYINFHHVRKIEVNTLGLGISRNFGRWDLGVALGWSRLAVDFEYKTSLDSSDLRYGDPVTSRALEKGNEAAVVLGGLYQIHEKLKLGFSYKIQPRFTYTEIVNNNEFTLVDFPDGKAIPVHFKIPDSFQLGLGFQPNDRWTLLLDVDWIQYQQLLKHSTALSRPKFFGPGQSFIEFEREDFEIGDDPEFRLGMEYLVPLKRHNLAFRCGGFVDPDHKTRFVGNPDEGELAAIFDVQEFIFNTGSKRNNVGYTAGFGVLFNKKYQWDVALVHSERFQRVVSSFLYRF